MDNFNMLLNYYKNKPYKRELAYLESTGTQWIDTGLHSQNGYLYQTEITPLEYGQYNLFFGRQTTSTGGQCEFCGFGRNQNEFGAFFKGPGEVTGGTIAVFGQKYSIEMNSVPPNKSFTVDEITYNLNRDTNYSNTLHIYLFCINNAGTQNNFSKIRMYKFKVFENNSLILDLIPVMDFNNVPCMYDKVSDKLFYNQGSEDFLYGEKMYQRELAYLESTGTQWIDSLWHLSSASNTFELDMQFTPSETQIRNYCCICGVNASRGSGNNQYYLVNLIGSSITQISVVNGDNAAGVAFNTSSTPISVKVTYDGNNLTQSTINGTMQSLSNTMQNLPNANMYIFSVNYAPAAGGITRQNISAKLYSFKIKENGVLKRNFIPVMDNNNIPCLYDKVSNQLFYNQGTGNFLYGEKLYKRELAYLESTGTQWIDSLWHLSSASNTFELDMQFTPSETQIRNYCCMCGVNASNGGGAKNYYLLNLVGSSITQVSVINGDNAAGILVNTSSTPIFAKIAYDGNGLTQSTINGTIENLSNTMDYLPNANMYIFSVNYDPAASVTRQNISAKLYSFKIKENGVLKRNFIPVMDNNNIPCLYDKVSNQLFYNQGTGNFLYGEKMYQRELAYIESTGTQWIDTGINTSTANKFTIETAFLASNLSNTEMDICGTYSDVDNTGFVLGKIISNNFAIWIGKYVTGQYTQWTTGQSYVTDNWYDIRLDITDTKLSFLCNSYSGQNSINVTWKSSGNLALFSSSSTYGSAGRYIGKGKMKYFKIIKDGVLIRDMIPVLDLNNVPCMYDKISKRFFYNQGTGDFLYGENLREIAYLQSTGTQWIDTGWVPTSENTNIEVEQDYCNYYKNAFGSANNSGDTNWFTFAVGTVGYMDLWIGSTGSQRFFNQGTVGVKRLIGLTTSSNKTYNIYSTSGNVSGTFSNAFIGNNISSFALFTCGGDYFSKNRINASRIWSCKIKQDNVLIRDMIPVLDSNNIPCMYDRVSNKLFYNKGSGQFLYGELT